jgi:hypothetical protein
VEGRVHAGIVPSIPPVQPRFIHHPCPMSIRAALGLGIFFLILAIAMPPVLRALEATALAFLDAAQLGASAAGSIMTDASLVPPQGTLTLPRAPSTY